MLTFQNNAKRNAEVLVIVLAGYKDYLWSRVFDRLSKYTPKTYDVCILSSGIVSDELLQIAKSNDWSYMSSDINNLCLAQNECVAEFSSAKYIFKLDEDIFVTDGTFETLYDTLIYARTNTEYYAGAVVPLINVNTVTALDVLKLTHKQMQYENKFGKFVVSNGLHHHKTMVENPIAAEFMWEVGDIDILQDKIRINDNYRVSMFRVNSTRFSIGMVLFTRDLFEDMGGFPVTLNAEQPHDRIGLGVDEKHLCTYAMLRAKPMLISMTCIVGHLAYGPQEQHMRRYFEDHKERF